MITNVYNYKKAEAQKAVNQIYQKLFFKKSLSPKGRMPLSPSTHCSDQTSNSVCWGHARNSSQYKLSEAQLNSSIGVSIIL